MSVSVAVMSKPAPASSRAKSRSLAASKPSGSGRRLGDLAYRRILEGLFDRRVPAGSFISQGELVRLLDVPIQPLREALRVLETEGILKIHARSGIEFLKADMELARSTYQFRSVIERSAARAYAETANLADITGLLEEHRTLLDLIERDGITEASAVTMEDLEQRFHGSIIGALRNPMIETTARRLKNYVDLIRLDVSWTSPRMIRTLHEHIDVLEACRKRDTGEAEAALGRHFQAALQRILGMV